MRGGHSIVRDTEWYRGYQNLKSIGNKETACKTQNFFKVMEQLQLTSQ